MQASNIFKSTNNATHAIEELDIRISGHYLYLLRQQVYIKKIKESKVSEQELNDYLSDAFNIKKLTLSEFKTECLPRLEKKIAKAIAAFQELLVASKLKNKDKDHALCYLNFLLDIRLETLLAAKKISNSKQIGWRLKLSLAFHEYEYLQLLSDLLKPALPEVHKEFQRVFKIKPVTSESKQKTEDKFSTAVKFNWHIFLKNLLTRLEKIATTFNSQEVIQHAFMVEDIKSQAIELNTITNNEVEMEFKKTLKNSVALFFDKVIPVLRFINQAELAAQLLNSQKELHENYWRKIDKKIIAIEDHYKRCSSEWLTYRKSLTNEQTDWAIARFEKSGTMTTQLFTQWKNNLTATEDQLKNDLEESYQTCSSITKDLNDLDYFISTIKNEIKTKNIKKDIPKNCESKNTINPNEEREIFLANQSVANQERREKINLDRQQREKEKQKKFSLNESETNTQETVIIFKNTRMEGLLNQLNDYWLNMLTAILTQDTNAKVTYNEVYYLITNHLGGKISETGNGSSHKCIWLEKAYLEILTTGDKTENTIPKNSSVKGGFFKQHGEAHLSGILSRFNLELVSDVLIKAGITLELVGQLEKNRLMANHPTLEMNRSLL